jgi:hypothetical protein
MRSGCFQPTTCAIAFTPSATAIARSFGKRSRTPARGLDDVICAASLRRADAVLPHDRAARGRLRRDGAGQPARDHRRPASNWRRKVGIDLEDWDGDARFANVCRAIREEGRGEDL